MFMTDKDRKQLDSTINTNVTRLLLGLLTILFVGLKLSDNIDWSWWWVLSPLWIPVVVGIVIGGFLILLGKTLGKIADKLDRRKAEKRAKELARVKDAINKVRNGKVIDENGEPIR